MLATSSSSSSSSSSSLDDPYDPFDISNSTSSSSSSSMDEFEFDYELVEEKSKESPIIEDNQVRNSRGSKVTKQPTRRPTDRGSKAIKQPTRLPTRSPTNKSNSGSSFRDGLKRGRREAERMWQNMGSDCANAFGFNQRIRQEIRRRKWNRSGRDSRETAFREGARAGMNEIVAKYEKKCLHDSPDECIELGDTAADIISFNHCRPNRFRATKRNNFAANCRKVGTGQCQGSVVSRVRQYCGSSPDTRKLRDLQNQCQGQVHRLTSMNSYEDVMHDADEPSIETPEAELSMS